MLIRQLRSVWVPYEVLHEADPRGKLCNDIPRFCHPEECKDFIQFNGSKLRKRLIQFREHYEEEFKKQYAMGVGRTIKWRYGPSYAGITHDRHGDRDY
jgi:hypothetical protein